MSNLKRMAGGLMMAAMLAWAGEAQADVGCTFTIAAIQLDTWGDFAATVVNASGQTFGWTFCSTAGSVTATNGYGGSGTITSDACKSTYTEFLTARASAKPITMYFHGPADCTNASGSLPPSGTLGGSASTPYPNTIVF